MAEDTKSNTPAKPEPKDEPADTPRKGKVALWDEIGKAAALALLKEQGKEPAGVTAKQVVDKVQTLKASDPLAKLIPQGVDKAQFTTRVADNTLWRLCPQIPGDKQAGGGYHDPPILLRSLTGVRPVVFTPWSKAAQDKRFGTK